MNLPPNAEACLRKSMLNLLKSLCKDEKVRQQIIEHIATNPIMFVVCPVGDLYHAIDDLQSPIEIMFALAAVWTRYGWPNNEEIKIEAQKQIGQYRVDFLISFRNKRLIVECDGHDFHEKTKEQAAKDKKRDRYLQSHDYKLFRFTGSEISNDCCACAEEAMKTLMKDTK